MLRGFEWHWFIGLSFAKPVHPEQANRRFHRWVRALERAAGSETRWVRSSEQQKRGVLHYHALLRFVKGAALDKLDAFHWMKRWESKGGGFARIRPYDDSQNGAYYLAKHVSNGGEIDFDDRWDSPLSLLDSSKRTANPPGGLQRTESGGPDGGATRLMAFQDPAPHPASEPDKEPPTPSCSTLQVQESGRTRRPLFLRPGTSLARHRQKPVKSSAPDDAWLDLLAEIIAEDILAQVHSE